MLFLLAMKVFGTCRILILLTPIFRYPTSGYPAARHGRAPPWSELGLWVPLLAANLLVEPLTLAAALCGTASGGCGSTPALGSVFRVGVYPLRVLSSFACQVLR